MREAEHDRQRSRAPAAGGRGRHARGRLAAGSSSRPGLLRVVVLDQLQEQRQEHQRHEQGQRCRQRAQGGGTERRGPAAAIRAAAARLTDARPRPGDRRQRRPSPARNSGHQRPRPVAGQDDGRGAQPQRARRSGRCRAGRAAAGPWRRGPWTGRTSRQREQAERDVDPEHPRPARAATSSPPITGPATSATPASAAQIAMLRRRLPARRGWLRGQQREATGQHQRRPGALRRPPGDQRPRRPAPARSRPRPAPKASRPPTKTRFAPSGVDQRAAREQQRGHRHGVGRSRSPAGR